jgi:Flp pilus assembly protein TadG
MGKVSKVLRSVRVGRTRREQAGQSLVEVALLTPLLLAMLLGSIELGRYAYLSILVGNAAHSGALYGAQSHLDAANAAGICEAAENDYQSGEVPATCTNAGTSPATTVTTCPSGSKCTASNLSVSTTDGCGCDVAGSYTQLGSTTLACSTANIDPATACSTPSEWAVTVSVTATATFRSLFNYPWIPSTLTVSRTATMRVEQD